MIRTQTPPLPPKERIIPFVNMQRDFFVPEDSVLGLIGERWRTYPLATLSFDQRFADDPVADRFQERLCPDLSARSPARSAFC